MADLRAEVQDDELAEAVARDHRGAAITAAQKAMLDYARKLTLEPAKVTAEDVEGLRRVGFSDAAIHDVAQVTAYFNYINRIADGLGVDLEPDMAP